MPKVAAIVPNFNHAPYLSRRIESILSQTFGDIDLLILDDASTDGSREIIERHRGRSRVRIDLSERNSGSVFAQWEKGIRATDSDYVWIAESDDWAEPDFLERLVPLLDADPSLALAYCQSSIVDPASRVSGSAVCWTEDLDPARWNSPFRSDGRVELRRHLIRKNTIPNASAVLQRRSALERCLPLRTDLRLCGDWHHWARMLATGGLAFTPEPLNHWRLASSNARTERPGILEWREGEPVIDLIADILSLTAAERSAAKFEFLRRCWDWLTTDLQRRRRPTRPPAPAQSKTTVFRP
jgi:glycosyltransferase involved in cell wall biosynthesis